MAIVKLKWFLILLVVPGAITGIDHLAGKCLDRSGRQGLSKFGQMGAAADPGQAFFKPWRKPLNRFRPTSF